MPLHGTIAAEFSRASVIGKINSDAAISSKVAHIDADHQEELLRPDIFPAVVTDEPVVGGSPSRPAARAAC